MRKINKAIFCIAFLLVFIPMNPIQASVNIDLLMASIDSKTYQVTVNGKISSGEYQIVTLKITDPNEKIEYIDQTISEENGDFNFSYTMKNPLLGKYTVIVGGEGVEEKKVTTFEYKKESSSQNTSNENSQENTQEDKKSETPHNDTSSSQNNSIEEKEEEKQEEKQDSLEIENNLEEKVNFKDIQNMWAKPYIENLVEKGIAKGISQDLFAPDLNVTRGQFAVFLGRALQLKEEKNSGIFTDVKEEQYFSGYIMALNKVGIIQGYSNGVFNPEEQITREQMVTMLMRAYTYITGKEVTSIGNTDASLFSDLNEVSEYALLNVKVAKALGIVHGAGENNFYPKKATTRAETAKMIVEFMNKAGL